MAEKNGIARYDVGLCEPGPDLLLAGLLFRKKCGPLLYEYPRLPLPDTHSSYHRHFVEDPCCNVHYYCSGVPRHTKSFPLFPNHYFNISGLLPCCKKMKKNCAFVGPPFSGAPVRPNMLNMPKSALSASGASTRSSGSASHQRVRLT